MATPSKIKPKRYDYLFKIILIGDVDTGKSSILLKFSENWIPGDDNVAPEPFISTIGVDFKVKTIVIRDDKKIKLQLWDTAGQERFYSITTSYYRGTMGILLVYDITCKKSFENVGSWLRSIREHASADVVISLVGNKSHMSEKRMVSVEEGQQFADQHGIRFKEVSCTMNININEVFYDMAEDILDKVESNPDLLPEQQQNTVRPGNEEARDRIRCC